VKFREFLRIVVSVIAHSTLDSHDRIHSIRDILGDLWLLVDPLELGVLIVEDLTLLEPESNFLLGVLDAVGAVANVAADVLSWSQHDLAAHTVPRTLTMA
jgi:hypothetical protein